MWRCLPWATPTLLQPKLINNYSNSDYIGQAGKADPSGKWEIASGYQMNALGYANISNGGASQSIALEETQSGKVLANLSGHKNSADAAAQATAPTWWDAVNQTVTHSVHSAAQTMGLTLPDNSGGDSQSGSSLASGGKSGSSSSASNSTVIANLQGSRPADNASAKSKTQANNDPGGNSKSASQATDWLSGLTHTVTNSANNLAIKLGLPTIPTTGTNPAVSNTNSAATTSANAGIKGLNGTVAGVAANNSGNLNGMTGNSNTNYLGSANNATNAVNGLSNPANATPSWFNNFTSAVSTTVTTVGNAFNPGSNAIDSSTSAKGSGDNSAIGTGTSFLPSKDVPGGDTKLSNNKYTTTQPINDDKNLGVVTIKPGSAGETKDVEKATFDDIFKATIGQQ